MLNFQCPLHLDQKIEWFCLEKDCPQRLLCSKCAIQSHKKEHKVEELKNLSNCNLQTFLKSETNSGYSLLNPEQYQNELQEISNEVAQFLQFCGEQYKEHYEKSVFQEVAPNYPILNKDIQQQMQQFQQNIVEQQQSITQEQLKNKLDQQLKLIHELIVPKAEQQENTYLNQKKALFSKINISFLNWLKAFYLSPFMNNCFHLYKLQLQTLTEQRVDYGKEDEYFLNFLETKWLTDYEVIQTNIEYNIQQMKNNLNSTMGQKKSLQQNQSITFDINNQIDNYQRIQLDRQLAQSPSEYKSNKNTQSEWPNYPDQSKTGYIEAHQQQVYKPIKSPQQIPENYQCIQQPKQQMIPLHQPIMSQMIQEQHMDHLQINNLPYMHKQNQPQNINPQYFKQDQPSPQRFLIESKRPAMIQREQIIQKQPMIPQISPQIKQNSLTVNQHQIGSSAFMPWEFHERSKREKSKSKQNSNHKPKHKHLHQESQETMQPQVNKFNIINQFDQYKPIALINASGPIIPPSMNIPGHLMQQNNFPKHLKQSPIKQGRSNYPF